MRSLRFALSLVCVALLASAVVPARAEEMVLNDVSGYLWYYGCSPTAGMMIMGYWDAYGYSNLIPGSNSWSSNKSAIQDAIASPGNIADYAQYNGVTDTKDDIYPDMSEINPGGAHANNSLADFMGTARSATGIYYGGTWANNIGSGMGDYASWRGYSFTIGGNYSSMPTWADFTNEIRMGRPVMFGVDSNGDGQADHSVTAIGFRDTKGYQEYACRDTWSTSTTPRWERFRPVSSSYTWGVKGMDATLRPPNATWAINSGSWGSASSWDNSVPTSGNFSCVSLGKTLTVSSSGQAAHLANLGTINVNNALNVQALHNEYGSIFVGSPGSSLAVAETLTNHGTISHTAGSVQTGGDLIIDEPVLGYPVTYSQSGGTVQVGGCLILSGQQDYTQDIFSYGRYDLTGGQLKVSDEIRIGYVGRLNWIGGTIQTPKIVSSGNGNYGSLAIYFDFDLFDLASGALTGGNSVGVEGGGTILVTGGATAVHNSGTVDVHRITFGEKNGVGNFALSGSGEILNTRLCLKSLSGG